MSASRAYLLLPLAALLAVAAAALPPADQPAPEPPRPKLAVLVVFDQMRGDFPGRWRALFGLDGFRRLEDGGAWFLNCHYPYATTTTGPGHASILTGCSGARHGIVNNEWWDARDAAQLYCATEPRYERVPPASADPFLRDEGTLLTGLPLARKKKPEGGSPGRMLSPTVADSLKQATAGRGRVIGLSLKDRAAILPAGHHPDGSYWFDTASGSFVTSTYYRDRLPAWVAGFNQERPADRWFGHDWARLRTDLDYELFSGPDDAPGEGTGVFPKNVPYLGRTFPHPMTGGLKKPGRDFYEAVTHSPYGNDLLLEFAKRAVVAERLGRHDTPDLLTVSFSSNDLLGHIYGPDSQEVLDVTLRSDLIVRDLLEFLDQQVGVGEYVVVLTADHGICPLPEQESRRGHPNAQRVPAPKLLAGADAFLNETFGKPGGDAKARWLEHFAIPWAYLNRRVVAERGRTPEEVAAALAGWLAQQPGVARAYTRQQLESPAPADDPLFGPMRKSYHPLRSGDVGVVLEPYCLPGSGTGLDTGTTHGSPYEYDTHVPLLVFGTGVRADWRTDPVTPQSAAAIIARALGVPPPRDAEAPVPPGLFR
jgi:hypothetical protein